MSKYYIVVEGGGSKLIALLLNEKFDIIRIKKFGGVNRNGRDIESVRKNVEGCISELLEGLYNGQELLIGGNFFCGEDFFADAVSRYTDNFKFSPVSEGEIALYSHGVLSSGMTLIVGTGCSVFYIKNGKTVSSFGGVGYALGDGGSGFDIGRSVLRYAYADERLYGEKTALTAMVAKEFGSVQEKLQRVYQSGTLVADVATLCSVAVKAASENDAVALRILKDAGKSIGGLVCDILKKCEVEKGISVYLSGGVVKSGGIVASGIVEYLNKTCPENKVILPVFEPVVGGAIFFIRQKKGSFSNSDFEELKQKYSTLLCQAKREEGE